MLICPKRYGIPQPSSEPDSFKIYRYRHGVLYDIIKVPYGSSFQPGSVDSNRVDDTFYGWSLSNNTTRKYTAASNITPMEDMRLYAIYSYTTSTTTYVDVLKSSSEVEVPTGGLPVSAGTYTKLIVNEPKFVDTISVSYPGGSSTSKNTITAAFNQSQTIGGHGNCNINVPNIGDGVTTFTLLTGNSKIVSRSILTPTYSTTSSGSTTTYNLAAYVTTSYYQTEPQTVTTTNYRN